MTRGLSSWVTYHAQQLQLDLLDLEQHAPLLFQYITQHFQHPHPSIEAWEEYHDAYYALAHQHLLPSPGTMTDYHLYHAEFLESLVYHPARLCQQDLQHALSLREHQGETLLLLNLRLFKHYFETAFFLSLEDLLHNRSMLVADFFGVTHPLQRRILQEHHQWHYTSPVVNYISYLEKEYGYVPSGDNIHYIYALEYPTPETIVDRLCFALHRLVFKEVAQHPFYRGRTPTVIPCM